MWGLAGILQACKSVLLKIWSFFSKLYPWAAPLAGLFSLYAVFKSNYDAVVTYINGLSSYLSGQPATLWISQANRLIPLSECMSMMLALFTLRIAAFVAKFVRCMMPF